jgi:hypothetical protein
VKLSALGSCVSRKVIITLSLNAILITGFVINEGEDAEQTRSGIFISSLIPGGPAERAKKIKPGTP